MHIGWSATEAGPKGSRIHVIAARLSEVEAHADRRAAVGDGAPGSVWGANSTDNPQSLGDSEGPGDRAW